MAGMWGPAIAAARMEEKRDAAGGGSNRNQRGQRPMMTLFSIFPLLTVPVVIYNLMAFVFAGSATAAAASIKSAGLQQADQRAQGLRWRARQTTIPFIEFPFFSNLLSDY